ncbi:MAG: ABC transporter permease subunit, partial [Magnetococcales bacterium]|nr:ABC transporter permease subunit [Magnetococcales bacterium]
EVAWSLGVSPFRAFYTVALPMAARGYVTAAVLCFAHTLGEFGVVLMVGGNIPGRTQVVSIAIYDHVESFQYGQAHLLSAILLTLSFLILLLVHALNRRGFGSVR